jgi:signal transduction histidine kinase
MHFKRMCTQRLSFQVRAPVHRPSPGAHGKLALSRRPDARFVTLLVEDDGPGLTEEQAESMLLPGQRLDETVPGFGFGLARA